MEEFLCEYSHGGSKINLHIELFTGQPSEPADQQQKQTLKSFAVVCHGLLCNTKSQVVQQVRDHLLKSLDRQSAICLFDFRGNGKSSGTTAYGNYEDEARDLKAVIEFMSDRLQVPCQLLIGHSKAASVVLIYAHLNRFAGDLVMLSGRFDMKRQPGTRFSDDQLKLLASQGWFDWKTYRRGCDGDLVDVFKITKADLDRRNEMEMSKYTQGLICRSVYVIHGDLDQTVPCEDAHSYHKHIPQSNLVILKGVDHFYTQIESIQSAFSPLLLNK
jgi:uncharacterized protein